MNEDDEKILAKFAFVGLDLDDDYDIYFGNLTDDPAEAFDKSAREWCQAKIEETLETRAEDILGLVVQVVGIVDIEDSLK